MNNNNQFFYNNQPNMDGSLPGTSVVVKTEIPDVTNFYRPIQTFMGFSVVPKIEPSSTDTKFDVSEPYQFQRGQMKRGRRNGANEYYRNLAADRKERRLQEISERARIKRLALAHMSGNRSVAIFANQNPGDAQKIQRVVAKLERKNIKLGTPRTVFICALYFRDVKLTNAFKESLQEVLDSELDRVPPGVALPKFENFELTDGFVRLRCADEYSVKWMESAINKISPLHGIELMVSRRPGLGVRTKIVAIVPGIPTDPRTVLTRLKRFNPELNTKPWKILQSETIEGLGMRIVLSINENLAKILLGTKKQAGMVMVSFIDFAQDNFGPETIVKVKEECKDEPEVDLSIVKKEPDDFYGPSTSQGSLY